MKKFKLILSIFTLVFLVSCSPDNKTTENKEVQTETKKKDKSIKQEDIKKEDNKNSKNSENNKVKISDNSGRVDKNKEDTVDSSKSEEKSFNNKLTDELKETLTDYSVSLIYNYDVTKDKYPKDNLQVIAKYVDENSKGWVIRYAKGKVGLGQIYNESETKVMVLFDKTEILENSSVENDKATDYKKAAKEILDYAIENGEINKDSVITYAY